MYSSIQELSNYQYNELKYDSTNPQTYSFLSDIILLLNKCNIDLDHSSNVYDDVVEEAVRQFQEQNKLNPTGILDNKTLQKLILMADIDEIKEHIEDTETTIESSITTSPHYNSFFDTDRYKIHRKNKKNIKIVLGNKGYVKTLIDVYMLSVKVEVDTSGNPIAEIYEFVAKDVKESDEISDINKYLHDDKYSTSDGYTSSDYKYIFDFKTSNKYNNYNNYNNKENDIDE